MRDELRAFKIGKHSFHPSALIPHPFLLVLLLLLTPACRVGQQRERPSSIPDAAQARVERVAAQIEEGRDEEIYREAAEEWRRTSTPEQSRAIFETLRSRLGKAKERARQTVHDERRTGSAGAEDHRLVIRYETRFERGEGMETFTLLEREGRWLLAGYMVNSDALKQ